MFDKILKELAQSAGATGAIMLDWEGEVVASYSHSTALEMDLIGAHHGIILNIIKDAASRHGVSEVSSVSITTEKTRLAISTIKEGYYLVVTMDRAKPQGKALFESKRAVARIEEEMG